MWFYTKLAMFLTGIIHSISLKWITGILFYVDPSTKKIHNKSLELQKTLGRSFLQVGVIFTLIPFILQYLGLKILSWLVTILSLFLTYGYLTFYNSDVTDLTRDIIAWKTKRTPSLMPEIDIRQRISFITDISNQIQSFIFEMVYYTPMNLLIIIVTLFDDRYFPLLLVIMDSFFNSAFYFFRRWPYDIFNVAYLERNMAYNLGYGLFVSIMVNIVLQNTISMAGYLLMSQWMIINAMIHSPPQQVDLNSFTQVYAFITKSSNKSVSKNAYNIHRTEIRTNLEYRKSILKSIFFLKSFITLTIKINNWLGTLLKKPEISKIDHSQQLINNQNNKQKKQNAGKQV